MRGIPSSSLRVLFSKSSCRCFKASSRALLLLPVADLQLQMNVSLLEVQCDGAVGLGAASPCGWARGVLRASGGVSLAE